MSDMMEDWASLTGEVAELENTNMNLFALAERLDGVRGYAKARRKVEIARQRVLSALIHLYAAQEVFEEKEG